MEEDQEVIDISSTDSEFDSWEDVDDFGEEINGFSCNSLYNDSVSDVHDTGHFALVDDSCPSTEYTHRSSPLNRVSDFTGKTRNGSILTSFGQTKDSGSNCKEVFDDNVAAAGMGNGNTQPSTYEGTMPLLKQPATPGNSSEQQAADFGDCMWRDGIEPSKKHIQRRTLPPSIVPIVHPKGGGMHFTVDGDNSSSRQGRGNFSKDSFMASQKTMVPGGDADAQHHDNIYNSDHEPWHATDNKKKRILPSSFQPSIFKTVPKPSIENNDDIQVLEIYPKLGACGEPKLTKLSNPKLSIKDNIDRRDGHVQIYENAGAHRQLPPWMNGESASRNVAFSSAMSSSSIYADSTRDHSGIGEKSMEEDERLIFQAALMDLAQPKNEIDLPAGLLTVSLLRHQRIALSWMKRKESSSHCTGGILADDQGLGKTVSVIALIQTERPYQVQFSRGFSDFVRSDALNLDEADNTFPEDTKPRPSEKHLEGKSQNGPSSNHSSLTESKIFNLVEIDDDQRALDRDTEDDLGANAKFESSGLDKHYHPVSKMKETGHSADCNSSKKVPAKSGVKCMMHKGRPTGGTLVVCPATILRQWARELDDKVPDDKKLSVLIYHGSSRLKDPTYIAKHDVVLTTYAIVTNEVPKQPLSIDDDGEERDMENCALSSDFSFQRKRKKISDVHKRGRVKKKGASDSSFDFQSGPLARVRWFRVVLDEAQTIKNFRTQVSRACCGLRAKRRWCLSGTPLQNSLDDLYSYFRFLKYDPFAVYTKFVQSIKNPIIRNATTGYKKLQVILRTIMLRRTKATLIDGEPIINLPPKVISLKKIYFSPDEREFYSNLEADSRQKFKAFTAAGTVNENYASILALLLRLRQACDHPLLVKGYHPGSVASASFKKAQELPRELLTRLLHQLEVSSAICGICSDQPEDAVVTMCGHVFCCQCISGYLCGDDNLCPASRCKETLDANSAFSRATLRKCIYGEPAEFASGVVKHLELGFQTSSKIEATMDILRSICKDQCPEAVEGSNERSPSPDGSSMTFMENHTYSNSRTFETKSSKLPPEIPVKAIIFSQWTSMLDMIETSLNCSLIQYRRLDGTMSLPLRDQAVKDFNSDPEVTVMLMSLKAGNLGLNMIAACHVILLDPWWNPTTEDQAIDRAHRIGQTRPVTVTRLTVSETVEDRIFALQEKKREMVSSAFGEDQALGAGRAARLTAEDLRYLFNV